jgi:hypothetical protein
MQILPTVFLKTIGQKLQVEYSLQSIPVTKIHKIVYFKIIVPQLKVEHYLFIKIQHT